MRYEEAAFAYLNELIEHRRNLHRIPELGNQEVETKKYLLECLSRFQPDELTEMLDTGIRCVFRGNGTKEAIAFRADMDALPVEEP